MINYRINSHNQNWFSLHNVSTTTLPGLSGNPIRLNTLAPYLIQLGIHSQGSRSYFLLSSSVGLRQAGGPVERPRPGKPMGPISPICRPHRLPKTKGVFPGQVSVYS
jgi:hypothetical protein